MFETVCRRGTDQTVLVDGAALARMQEYPAACKHSNEIV